MSVSHSVKSLVMGFEESVLCFAFFCSGFGFGFFGLVSYCQSLLRGYWYHC